IEAMSADLPASNEELAQAIQASKDVETATRAAEWTAKRPSAFWDIYYGLNLLSSPATHIAKTTGEATAQIVNLSDRTLGAIVAKPFHMLGLVKGPGLTLSEAPAYLSGAIEHIGEAFQAFKNAYSGGRVFGKGGILGEIDPTQAGRMLYGEIPAAPSAEVAADQAGGLLAKFYDVAATKTRAGLVGNLQSAGQFVKNTMGGVADFWKVLTFHGEIAAQAERLGQTAEEVAFLKANPTASMLTQAAAKA